jgi:hypothetical protein
MVPLSENFGRLMSRTTCPCGPAHPHMYTQSAHKHAYNAHTHASTRPFTLFLPPCIPALSTSQWFAFWGRERSTSCSCGPTIICCLPTLLLRLAVQKESTEHYFGIPLLDIPTYIAGGQTEAQHGNIPPT